MSTLTLNCGSSSVKFQLRDDAGHVELNDTVEHTDLRESLQNVLAKLPHTRIEAVGHRLVNGFALFGDSVQLDQAAMDKLRGLARRSAVATHHSLECVERAQELLPEALHIGVFDSKFHRTLTPAAYLYALPWEQYEKRGIRRWGFHGLSHESVSERFAPQRVVSCHLGNGASLCAIHEGRSIDTTMGFTALEGLAMGSRAGDLDAGVLLDMIMEQGLPPAAVGEMLTRKSGLLGISGISSDVRTLEKAAAQGDPRARTALDVFCHRVTRYIGAFAAVLGGIDVLVFTGGIGEHAAALRAQIVASLEFLGIAIDPAKNQDAQADCCISTAAARVATWVIRADEERLIAREVQRFLHHQPEEHNDEHAPTA